MPIYEYRCHHCRSKVSLLVRSFSPPSTPACPACGSLEMTRLFSPFAILKSDRLEALADISKWGPVDENDPRSLARWARRMGQEVGEDLGPEFDEMVDRMGEGEVPEDFLGDEGDNDW